MTVSITPLANSGGSGATQATLSGVSGLGNPISIVMPAGQVPTGVQFYRNGSPIAGATSAPYIQVAADIPALGAADISITATYTGITYTSTAFVNSNPIAPPGQPTKPVMTPGVLSISLAWAPGSGATSSYFTGIDSKVVALTTNPQTITGIAAGSYTGTVTSHNAQGDGPPSVQADAVVVLDTPIPSASPTASFNSANFNEDTL